MEQLIAALLTVLVTVLIYGIKLGVNKLDEISKAMGEMKVSIGSIQTHIEKSIEVDIVEMKNQINTLFSKVNAISNSKLFQ